MPVRTTVWIGFLGFLTACGNVQEDYIECLDAATSAWELCADDCDASYPDDDAAWEACMNGCDQTAEYEEDDCNEI